MNDMKLYMTILARTAHKTTYARPTNKHFENVSVPSLDCSQAYL